MVTDKDILITGEGTKSRPYEVKPNIKNQTDMSTERELSFGEKLVGLTFNPSADERVDRVKALCAELADLVEQTVPSGSSATYLQNLIKGSALREILNAQMNVVKLVTLKY